MSKTTFRIPTASLAIPRTFQVQTKLADLVTVALAGYIIVLLVEAINLRLSKRVESLLKK